MWSPPLEQLPNSIARSLIILFPSDLSCLVERAVRFLNDDISRTRLANFGEHAISAPRFYGRWHDVEHCRGLLSLRFRRGVPGAVEDPCVAVEDSFHSAVLRDESLCAGLDLLPGESGSGDDHSDGCGVSLALDQQIEYQASCPR